MYIIFMPLPCGFLLLIVMELGLTLTFMRGVQEGLLQGSTGVTLFRLIYVKINSNPVRLLFFFIFLILFIFDFPNSTINTMKRIFFLLACVISIEATAQDCPPAKGDATVPQVQGVYIFSGLQPKHSYKFLGQVKTGSGFVKVMFGEDGESSENTKIEKLVKRAKKEFPETEAIIIRFSKDASDKADCVKFE